MARAQHRRRHLRITIFEANAASESRLEIRMCQCSIFNEFHKAVEAEDLLYGSKHRLQRNVYDSPWSDHRVQVAETIPVNQVIN